MRESLEAFDDRSQCKVFFIFFNQREQRNILERIIYSLVNTQQQKLNKEGNQEML